MRYLYIVTNLINNKKYVGQRNYTKNKSPEKDNYMGSGTLISYAIKKYGKENFSKQIIAICNTQNEIDKLEIDYIIKNNVLNNKNEWYNIDAGG